MAEMTELQRWTWIRDKLVELRKLVKIEAHWSNYGICDYLQDLNGVEDDLAKFYKSWTYWTGSYTYPVPAGEYDQSRAAAHDAFNNSTPKQMWMEGEYADMRKLLLAHLIKKTKARVRRLERLEKESGA